MTPTTRILLLTTTIATIAAATWYAKHSATSTKPPRESTPITLPGVPYHL